MERGQTVIVKAADEIFYNLRGEIAGFNPLYKWSVRVKFHDSPYNIAHGYWFSKSDIVVVREKKAK